MKKIGIALIIIGLLLTVMTGFVFNTKKKVVDLGSVEISRTDVHHVNWSPYAGVGIILVGGILLLVGGKKSI